MFYWQIPLNTAVVHHQISLYIYLKKPSYLHKIWINSGAWPPDKHPATDLTRLLASAPTDICLERMASGLSEAPEKWHRLVVASPIAGATDRVKYHWDGVRDSRLLIHFTSGKCGIVWISSRFRIEMSVLYCRTRKKVISPLFPFFEKNSF